MSKKRTKPRYEVQRRGNSYSAVDTKTGLEVQRYAGIGCKAKAQIRADGLNKG